MPDTNFISKKIDISELKLKYLNRVNNDDDINKIGSLSNDEPVYPFYNLHPQQKIIAIGNINGDLTSLICILLAAELINNNLEWIGKDSYVVFTGNLLNNFNSQVSYKDGQHYTYRAHETIFRNRWNEIKGSTIRSLEDKGWEGSELKSRYKELKKKAYEEHKKFVKDIKGRLMKQHPADEITIISFLDRLNTHALIQGGRILLCLGLGEAENLCNIFDNVSEPTMRYFSDFLGSREEQFKPNSILRQKLSCLFQPFILIDNKYFFCHGGITLNFLHFLNDVYTDQFPVHFLKISYLLNKFNEDIKKFIRSGFEKYNRMHKMLKRDFRRMWGNVGFFSTKIYDDLDSGCNDFTSVRQYMGLPDLILIKGRDHEWAARQWENKAKASCNNGIYLIDTQISRIFDPDDLFIEKLISDNMNYLEIDQGIFNIINVKLIDDESKHRQMLETFIEKDPFKKGIYDIIGDKLGSFVSGILSDDKEITVDDWKKSVLRG
jgi:hypothetical protein